MEDTPPFNLRIWKLDRVMLTRSRVGFGLGGWKTGGQNCPTVYMHVSPVDLLSN